MPENSRAKEPALLIADGELIVRACLLPQQN
jgi:hypothetical protein